MSSDSDRTIDSDELNVILSSMKKNKYSEDSNSEENLSSNSERKKKSSKRSKKAYELSDSNSESDGDQELFSVPSNAKSEVKQRTDERPPCKYGEKCFRKNPDHLKAFSHKRSYKDKQTASPSVTQSPKRKKVDPQSGLSSSSTPNENPFNFFVTTVQGISRRYNDGIALSIKDLLSPSMGKLKSSVQFNYMFDVPWLMEQYPEEFRKCPLAIVHGETRETKKALEKSGAQFSNVEFCQARLEIPFGTHHTKMMFLFYENGLRVVIHTSNLVSSDWAQKTQGMWVSPLFPPLKGEPSLTKGDSITRFKADLIEYVSSYIAKGLEKWCCELQKYDMSAAKVFIIASSPGRHIGSKKTLFGHLKLRKVLNSHGPSKDSVTLQWPVISQFSSIGSLGSSPDLWMCGEWLTSLTTVRNTNSVMKPSSLLLVYPSVENVRKSLEGYPAGASLPYSIKVAMKQPYLKQFMHEWKSERIGRSEASPHIKTYLRLSPDSQKIAWFLVTSANLSKAAWGSFEKKDSQFMIRSFELGVLFLPEYFNKSFFTVPSCSSEKDSIPFPVPFDIPVSKYSERDEPWIWDIPHIHAPDRNGNKWCPP